MYSMRNFWIYSLARLGIIVVVGLILWPFLGLNLVMALAAVIIGALLSFLLLGSMRRKVASDIEEGLVKRTEKKQAKRRGVDEEAEDAYLDDEGDKE